MTTDNKFTEVMTNRSHAELLEIVGERRNDYQPDAIIAAEAELKTRNLSPEKIESVKKTIKTKKQSVAEKANEPLKTHWKILTLLFPGILNLLIADGLKAEGYERQYKEIWRWFFYGGAFYIGLFILLLILSAVF